MSRLAWIVTASLLLTAVASPMASAHEHYHTDDGQFSLVLGEQGEPVYTYDWTNLDFFVNEDAENGTGGPVPGVHETVNATLIAPGGEELAMDLEPQHGAQGAYQFVQDYYLTQPGQYQLQLDGHINGTDVTGTYLLPGPRQAMNGQGFPADTVPDLLELQEENEDLRDRVSELETQISDLESQVQTMDTQANNGEQANNSPAGGTLAILAVLGAIAAIGVLRRPN